MKCSIFAKKKAAIGRRTCEKKRVEKESSVIEYKVEEDKEVEEDEEGRSVGCVQ